MSISPIKTTPGFERFCIKYNKEIIDKLFKQELTGEELGLDCFSESLELASVMDNVREEQNEPLLQYITGSTGLSMYGCMIAELAREFNIAINNGTFSLMTLGIFLRDKECVAELIEQFGTEYNVTYTSIASHVRVTLSFVIDVVALLGAELADHLTSNDPASLEHYITLRETFCSAGLLSPIIDAELDNYLIDNDICADFIGDYAERTSDPFNAMTSSIVLHESGSATSRVVWCSPTVFIIEVYYENGGEYRDCIMGGISNKSPDMVHIQQSAYRLRETNKHVDKAISRFLEVGEFTLAPPFEAPKTKN